MGVNPKGLPRLENREPLARSMETEHWLILTNGEWCHEKDLGMLLDQATMIVACDGALNACEERGIQPNVVIGDLDSVNEALLSSHEQSGCLIINVPNPDLNDLAKGLEFVEEQGSKACVVIGATGGEREHEWANMMACAASGLDIQCIAPKEEFRFFCPGESYSIDAIAGSQFSIFGVPFAEGVKLTGCTYVLRGEHLELGSRGLHNQANGTLAISYEDGRLLMIRSLPASEEEGTNEA